MSNQLLLWSVFVVPWLTLFLMRKEDIRRFLPVALFSALSSIIIVEIGITLNWWAANETAYPLRTLSYLLGLNPIITMWMMRFLYRKFFLYIAIDAAFNLGFAFVFLGYLLQRRGIYIYTGTGPFFTFFLTTAHGILLYVYHMWQQAIFAHSYTNSKKQE
jgi:hypothetical protein